MFRVLGLGWGTDRVENFSVRGESWRLESRNGQQQTRVNAWIQKHMLVRPKNHFLNSHFTVFTVQTITVQTIIFKTPEKSE